MPPLSDPSPTETLAIPHNGSNVDVDAGRGSSPKKIMTGTGSSFFGTTPDAANAKAAVACVVASESSIEISFDHSHSSVSASVDEETAEPSLATSPKAASIAVLPSSNAAKAASPNAKASIEKKKQQKKTCQRSKKDKKQLKKKDEKASAQSQPIPVSTAAAAVAVSVGAVNLKMIPEEREPAEQEPSAKPSTSNAKAKAAAIPKSKAAIIAIEKKTKPKPTKPPKLSKKDKKQIKKEEKAFAQSSQSQALLDKNNHKHRANAANMNKNQNHNNLKNHKKAVATRTTTLTGLKKKKKKKETEEERNQALAAISTSRSWDVEEEDEDRNNNDIASSLFKQKQRKNDLRVVTTEDEAPGGELSPLQMAQAALVALVLSPGRLVNGLSAFPDTDTATDHINHNHSESDSEEDDDEDDDDDDITEGNSTVDFRSSREPGFFSDAVDGFLSLLGLDGDNAADDASKSNKNKRDRRSNNANGKVNGKDKEKEVTATTTEEESGCMGGITATIFSGLSCRSSESTSNHQKGGVSKVRGLLSSQELQQSPSASSKNKTTSSDAVELNRIRIDGSSISLADYDSMIMSDGLEGHEKMYATPSNYNNKTKYYLNNKRITIDNPMGESPRKITHIVDVDLSKFDLANVNHLDSMSSIETPMLSDLSSVQMTRGRRNGAGRADGSIATTGSDLLDPNVGDIFVDEDIDEDINEIRQSASDESSVDMDHHHHHHNRNQNGYHNGARAGRR
jgi:hypothetical protein